MCAYKGWVGDLTEASIVLSQGCHVCVCCARVCGFVCAQANLTLSAAYSQRQLIVGTSKNMHGILKAEFVSAAAAAADRECAWGAVHIRICQLMIKITEEWPFSEGFSRESSHSQL